MKPSTDFLLVFVTAPEIAAARKLARAALELRLVACANLVSGVESHYWWQGKIDSASEVLCLFKTHSAKLDDLEKFVLANHPYDTPEIVAVPIGQTTERYLQWLGQSMSLP